MTKQYIKPHSVKSVDGFAVFLTLSTLAAAAASP